MIRNPPRSLGARPRRPVGPDSSGELLLEHLSEFEGWAVLDAAGRQVNPFCRTAPALAYYLSRERLAGRIGNLDVLPAKLQEIARKSPLK